MLYGCCDPRSAGLGRGFRAYHLLETTLLLKEMLRTVRNFIKAHYKIE